MDKTQIAKRIVLLVIAISFLGLFFAQVEIQIEGKDGWAKSLPTWRIEEHPLLDIFWGGRAMTGYHAWVFSFMFLIFHFPHILLGKFFLSLELRILGSIMLFWIIEDFLWFVLNPHWGLGKFSAEHISWHKHWAMGIPVDYLTFSIVGLVLIYFSFCLLNQPKGLK